MYSNINTMTKGVMKVASFGTNFNLAFKLFNLFSRSGKTQSGVQLFASKSPFDVLITWFVGYRNKNQNVAAWIAGTINIICSVSRGEIPSAIKPAQLIEPIIPADPVPDDHAAITFL